MLARKAFCVYYTIKKGACLYLPSTQGYYFTTVGMESSTKASLLREVPRNEAEGVLVAKKLLHRFAEPPRRGSLGENPHPCASLSEASPFGRGGTLA